MELVGQRGYYGMTAINECERRQGDGELYSCVGVFHLCVSESMKPRLSQTSVTCRVFNKVGELGVGGLRLLSDGTASLCMSCLTPDQPSICSVIVAVCHDVQLCFWVTIAFFLICSAFFFFSPIQSSYGDVFFNVLCLKRIDFGKLFKEREDR